MPKIPAHTSWLVEDSTGYSTSDGVKVTRITFEHEQDPEILNEWAEHFRSHYRTNAEIETTAEAFGISKEEFLRQHVFPQNNGFGKSVRSGDFSEILVADYLEYVKSFEVPRTKYYLKDNPNTSARGVDIIAFKFSPQGISVDDELLTVEVKATLNSSRNSLQLAIDDSKKDHSIRLPYSLAAMSARLSNKGLSADVAKLHRFMNKVQKPYTEISGAAEVCSTQYWDATRISNSVSSHPNDNCMFLVVSGDDLFQLVEQLYEVACVTA